MTCVLRHLKLLGIYLVLQWCFIVKFVSDGFPQWIQELRRLQGNFCQGKDYDIQPHIMLVAVENYHNAPPIGFVDLDARREPGAEYTQCMCDSGGGGLQCTTRKNSPTPMPHLSDLVISPLHLRRGVGTALIKVCVHGHLTWLYFFCKLQTLE